MSILAKRYHPILQDMRYILLLKYTTCYYSNTPLATTLRKPLFFYLLVTAKSAKRTTKTQTLWTFRKSGQNLGALQLISTDKLNPIKDGRVYHFAECCTSLLRSLIAGVPNVSASYPLTISIFLKNTSRNAAVSDCYTILFSTTSAPLCDLI